MGTAGSRLLMVSVVALATSSCSTPNVFFEPDNVSYRPVTARVVSSPTCLAQNIYSELTGLYPGDGALASDAPEPGYPPSDFDAVAVVRCERRTDDAGALSVDSVRLEGDIAAVSATFSADSQRFPDNVFASCAYSMVPPAGLWFVDAAGEAFRPTWPASPCGLQNAPLDTLSALTEVSRSSHPTGYVFGYTSTCESVSGAAAFATTTPDDVSSAEERERSSEALVVPSLVMPIDDVDALQLCVYPANARSETDEVNSPVAGTKLDLSRAQSADVVGAVADAPLAPPCEESSARIASTQLRRPDGSGQSFLSFELGGCRRATGFGYYRAIPVEVSATLEQS